MKNRLTRPKSPGGIVFKTISMPLSVAARADAKVEVEFESNFSRYVRFLIRRDLHMAESKPSK
jgi:hypothetical protein